MIAGVLILTGIGSASAADAAHGRVLVERWCAACHIISPEQQRGADNAPSFASIAARGNFSAKALASFLLEPHPKMPNMALTRRETEDIAAYIASLHR